MKQRTERWVPIPFRNEEQHSCRVLMKDGVWLVPPEERPKIAPAPPDEDRRARGGGGN